MIDKLSKYEKNIFSQLSREKSPPIILEERVVQKLYEENLIQSKSFKMNNILKRVASIAAMVVIFFIGSYVGRQSSNDTAIDPANGYMLLLHEDENFTPGEPLAMYNEYAAWMKMTSEKGMNITGQELKNSGVMVSGSKNVVEYMNGDAEQRTTGYFVFEASSLEDAVEVAKNNPHVKYGGIVEVKEFIIR